MLNRYLKFRPFGVFVLSLSIMLYWATLTDASGAPPSFIKSENYVFNSRFRSDCLLISHRDQIIYERYGRGYNPSMKHGSWSLSKSIVSLLVGMAIDEGYIGLDEPIGQIFSGLDSEKSPITIKNLLQMTSGIDFRETGVPVERSDSVSMLYRSGAASMSQFVLSLNQKYKPGEVFNYSSGDTQLLMGALKIRIPSSFYPDYPETHLFQPLDIHHATLETDRSGIFIGSSYLYLTPRDFLKFGSLYLHEGRWRDRQLVSHSFIQFQKTLSPGFLSPKRSFNKSAFGAHLWLNLAVPELAIPGLNSDLPADLFAMVGYQGQFLFIFPSLDLLVLRLGQDQNETFNPMRMLSLILSEMKENDLQVRKRPPQLEVQSEEQALKPVKIGHEPRTKKNNQDASQRKSHRFRPSSSFLKLPSIGAAVLAKEFCSCYFVIGQSKEVCKDLLKMPIPFYSVSANLQTNTATAWFLHKRKTALFVSEKVGCQLQ